VPRRDALDVERPEHLVACEQARPPCLKGDLVSGRATERARLNERGEGGCRPGRGQQGGNRGCRNGAHLFRTIRSQGFRGQYGIVALYIRRYSQAQDLASRQRRSDQPLTVVTSNTPHLLTPRDVAGPPLARPVHRGRRPPVSAAHRAIARAGGGRGTHAGLCLRHPPAPASTARTTAHTCTQSSVTPFQRFAKGPREDIATVQAAVTLSWGQGPIEGQIHRLKMMKRQMFGWARLHLLTRGFLLVA
jgi:transposase